MARTRKGFLSTQRDGTAGEVSKSISAGASADGITGQSMDKDAADAGNTTRQGVVSSKINSGSVPMGGEQGVTPGGDKVEVSKSISAGASADGLTGQSMDKDAADAGNTARQGVVSSKINSGSVPMGGEQGVTPGGDKVEVSKSISAGASADGLTGQSMDKDAADAGNTARQEPTVVEMYDVNKPRQAQFLINLPDDFSCFVSSKKLETIEMHLSMLKPLPDDKRIREVDMEKVDAIQSAFSNGTLGVSDSPYGGFFSTNPSKAVIFDGVARLTAFEMYLEGGRIPVDTKVIVIGYHVTEEEIDKLLGSGEITLLPSICSSLVNYVKGEISRFSYDEENLLALIRRSASASLGINGDDFLEYFNRRTTELVDFLLINFPTIKSVKMAKDSACAMMVPSSIFAKGAALQTNHRRYAQFHKESFANYSGKYFWQSVKARCKNAKLLEHMNILLDSLLAADPGTLGTTEQLVTRIKNMIRTRKNNQQDGREEDMETDNYTSGEGDTAKVSDGVPMSVGSSSVVGVGLEKGGGISVQSISDMEITTRETSRMLLNADGDVDFPNPSEPTRKRIPKKRPISIEEETEESTEIHPFMADVYQRRSSLGNYWIVFELTEGHLSMEDDVRVIKRILKEHDKILISVSGFHSVLKLFSLLDLSSLTVANIYRDSPRNADNGIQLSQTVLVATKCDHSNWLNIVGTSSFLSYKDNLYEMIEKQIGRVVIVRLGASASND